MLLRIEVINFVKIVYDIIQDFCKDFVIKYMSSENKGNLYFIGSEHWYSGMANKKGSKKREIIGDNKRQSNHWIIHQQMMG